MVEADYKPECKRLANGDWCILIAGVFLWSFEDFELLRTNKMTWARSRQEVKV